MTSLVRNAARQVQDELRDLMALRPASEEAAREEGERVYRALVERQRRSARDRADYARDPDTYVWLAAFNMLDIFDRGGNPDRLEVLRRLDAHMSSLAGSGERQWTSSEDAAAERRRHFNQLPSESQAVLQLCRHHGLTLNDIARLVGTSTLLAEELLVSALSALDENQ
jgi:DNA-directed RNA polymerase specialized sigma24 family protein